MTRSVRVAVCAASLFLIAAGSANAQTAPTSPTTTVTTPTTAVTTSATDFSLPDACKPSDESTTTYKSHGQQVRACIRALRAELADGNDHQGLGELVSALAKSNGHRHKDDDDSDDMTTGGSTSSHSTVTD